MRNIDLSIIVVNYNTFKLTRDTIDSCLAEPTHYTYEIFLVDNKSTDDSLEKLQEYFKSETERGILKIIPNQSNDGFAKANNIAIEQAKGDFILLLNSDTLMKQSTIDKCMDYITDKGHDDIDALGCKVSLADGSLDKACKRSFPNPANSFYKLFHINVDSDKNDYNLDDLDDDGIYEIDCLVGAFMLVRRTTIDEVGLLDDAFFMYGEDIDWCYRIKQAGWKIVYFGQAEIIHYKGASSEDKNTKKRNPKIIYEFYRAMYVFYKKHYTKKYNFLVNIAVYIGIGVLLVFNLVRNAFRS
ncbi:glycosyl transferase GT2 family [Methanobrevibacter ruminantium M1]|uniref:Glycosyl transferase GT2 family n=1 Tax=Methanobrevibacter ruminantium (strain ATCC 35063 / DSM 1093 / JCM 13430 / OCM 146 / M1) TaxID=634498 RepID=D3DYP4_METRM|nr:glycosyl transferase GT2 family [Methanobrevibacter ruminantium M1]